MDTDRSPSKSATGNRHTALAPATSARGCPCLTPCIHAAGKTWLTRWQMCPGAHPHTRIQGGPSRIESEEGYLTMIHSRRACLTVAPNIPAPWNGLPKRCHCRPGSAGLIPRRKLTLFGTPRNGIWHLAFGIWHSGWLGGWVAGWLGIEGWTCVRSGKWGLPDCPPTTTMTTTA